MGPESSRGCRACVQKEDTAGAGVKKDSGRRQMAEPDCRRPLFGSPQQARVHLALAVCPMRVRYRAVQVLSFLRAGRMSRGRKSGLPVTVAACRVRFSSPPDRLRSCWGRCLVERVDYACPPCKGVSYASTRVSLTKSFSGLALRLPGPWPYRASLARDSGSASSRRPAR